MWRVRKHRFISLVLVIQLLICMPAFNAMAYQDTTLRPGMKDDRVKVMQEALIALGYLGGTPDGIFGTNTENAIRKFQRANHMEADGLAGLRTLELLYEKAGMNVDPATGSVIGWLGTTGGAGASETSVSTESSGSFDISVSTGGDRKSVV